MLRFDLGKFTYYFFDNLTDWCSGGPKEGGWTRSGPRYSCPPIQLTNYRRELLDVDDILSKNKLEVEKWHIAFLQNPVLEQTLYYKEYLLPRCNKLEAKAKADFFLTLHRKISAEGYNEKFPVLVADISELGLGLTYFRFDGCHRAAIAKVLGIPKIPAYLFKVTAMS